MGKPDDFNPGRVRGVYQLDKDGKSRSLTIDEIGLLDVKQTELFSIFNLILKELKIMNLHLATMTDNELYEWEID